MPVEYSNQPGSKPDATMARVTKNNIAEGLKGRLGDLIFKQYSYGTVVSQRPDRSRVVLSPKQKAANQRFIKAVAYAKKVKRTPALQALYKKQLKKGKSLYHLALADFMKNGTSGKEL